MRRIIWLAAVVSLAAAGSAVAAPTHVASAKRFSVTLSGPGGSGTALLKLNPGGKVCYVMDVTLTTPGDVPAEPAPGLGNAHIHFASTNGIAVPLDAAFAALGGGRFVAEGCVRDDKDLVRDILVDPEAYYVNIHTVTFPGGAVTGPLA